MDVLGRYTEYTSSSRAERRGMEPAASGKKRRRRSKRDDGRLKIVYISSPMKVKTCESKFRSLVQELTGKDSQVAMFMEVTGSCVGEETCQAAASESRSSEVVGVEDKVEQFGQWGASSDQSLSAVVDELGSFVMDRNLAAGEGVYGWELEYPWHLLME